MDVINDDWEMMIASPPCTFLTVAGNRSFVNSPYRWKMRLDAMLFVYELLNAEIKKICLENPVGVISTHIRRPDQYVEPYEYGDPYAKKTGLWLKNLPLLKPTNIVEPEYLFYKHKRTKSGYSRYSHFGKLGKNKGKERSVTPIGIAKAMAEQWG
ncbi:MAG TPA: DNA cytosine methyltransferase [bacterium]|nr:DNA cytosine methyltransferase [bacterium]